MKHTLVLTLFGALFIAPAPKRLSAQTDLPLAATTAAAAWSRHDFVSFLGGARAEIRIPGVSVSGPIPSEQAVALLGSYVLDAVEVEVTTTTATVVSDRSGYAELRRRFRRSGVGDPQEETILLGFTRSRGVGGSWGPWVVGVVQLAGRSGR